jgi:hypothetical protein
LKAQKGGYKYFNSLLDKVKKESAENPEKSRQNIKSNCKMYTKLKKIIVLFMLTIPLICVSCVKQKNCDCGETGTFVYLKEPYKMKGTACNNIRGEKIVAHFFTNKMPDSITDIDRNKGGITIKGYVPQAFRSGNPIAVRLCLKWDCDGRIVVMVAGPEIYSLKCIEKKDE